MAESVSRSTARTLTILAHGSIVAFRTRRFQTSLGTAYDTLSRMVVETTILLAASRHVGENVLKEAAALYKVDTDAIALKVK